MSDAGDEKQVQARKAAAKFAREQEIDEFKAVLRTREGRAVMWRILEYCHIYHAAPEGLENMARFEGGRDIGTWLMNECFTSYKDAYSLMQRENRDSQSGEKKRD
jgi:hypothetical protein